MKLFRRRDFITFSVSSAFLLPVISRFKSAALVGEAWAKEAAKVALPVGTTEAPATDAVVQALGYKPNVKDIDYKKYPQRKKPDAKNQFCESCAFYTKLNEGWGKCQMITTGAVSSKGWCGSYQKKPV